MDNNSSGVFILTFDEIRDAFIKHQLLDNHILEYGIGIVQTPRFMGIDFMMKQLGYRVFSKDDYKPSEIWNNWEASLAYYPKKGFEINDIEGKYPFFVHF